MYVYNEYWKSNKAMLLYPSNLPYTQNIEFTPFKNEKHACSLGKISVFKDEILNSDVGLEILE